MDVTVACVCPSTAKGDVRHPNGDRVTLRESLDFRAGITVQKAIVLLKADDPDVSVAEILATLTETYVLLGIESWTLVDAKNVPVQVSKPAIRERILPRMDVAMAIANAADELYLAATILPLVSPASTSSPPSSTNGSTSAPTVSPKRRPKPSRPSSTSTIQTAATVTTSPWPDGASSS